MATHAVKPDAGSIYARPKEPLNASLMKPTFAAAVTNSTTVPGNQETRAGHMVAGPSSVMLMPQQPSALMTTLEMSAAVVRRASRPTLSNVWTIRIASIPTNLVATTVTVTKGTHVPRLAFAELPVFKMKTIRSLVVFARPAGHARAA